MRSLPDRNHGVGVVGNLGVVLGAVAVVVHGVDVAFSEVQGDERVALHPEPLEKATSSSPMPRKPLEAG